jgi:hypothetical protein
MKVYMSKREALDFGLCLEKITIVSLLFLAHIEVIVEHRFIVGDLWVELMVKWWFWTPAQLTMVLPEDLDASDGTCHSRKVRSWFHLLMKIRT